MISDRDILFVAKHCNLTNTKLHNLYLKLGLQEAEIDAAKYKTIGAGMLDFQLQAVDVLRYWRKVNAKKASRMTLMEAAGACGYHTQVGILKQKWDIILEGKRQCQFHMGFTVETQDNIKFFPEFPTKVINPFLSCYF